MRLPGGVVFLLVLSAVIGGCLGGGSKGDDRGTLPTATTGTQNGTLFANFGFAPANPAAGEPVSFTDLSRDNSSSIASRAWDFGDGGRGSTAANPTHTYETAQVYTVSLTVGTESGVNATAIRLVPVREGNFTPPGPGQGDYLVFGEPVTVQANFGGEPVIAVDGDGRIFVSPIGELYRSADDGKSFERLDYPLVTSGDTHVVVDLDNRVWISDLGGLTPPLAGSVTVWTSEDHGDSWTKGNPAATDSAGVDRQWLAAWKDGTGYLLTRQAPFGTILTKTTDAGLTWTRPNIQFFGWTAFPVLDPADGTLYIFQGVDNDIEVSVSTDGGATFDTTKAADRQTNVEMSFVSGAVDDAGNAYVVWSDKDSSQWDIWLAASTDKGEHWSRPARVSSAVGTHIFPWVAAGADGDVVVVWYGTNATGNPDGLPDSAEWRVMSAHSVNASGEDAVFTQSPVTGTVHTGEICTEGLNCDLEGDRDRDLLDFISVAVTPDGRAAVVYGEDGTSGNTKTRFALQVGGPLSR